MSAPKALSRASPVLKALLSPRFSEGTTLRTEGTVEVALPDDDVQVLQLVCNALHFRHEEVDFTRPLAQLMEVATVADKYDLGFALRPLAEVWILNLLEKVADLECYDLLNAAFLLQHTRMFRAVGEHVVWDISGSSLKSIVVQRAHADSAVSNFFRKHLRARTHSSE